MDLTKMPLFNLVDLDTQKVISTIDCSSEDLALHIALQHQRLTLYPASWDEFDANYDDLELVEGECENPVCCIKELPRQSLVKRIVAFFKQ